MCRTASLFSELELAEASPAESSVYLTLASLSVCSSVFLISLPPPPPASVRSICGAVLDTAGPHLKAWYLGPLNSTPTVNCSMLRVLMEMSKANHTIIVRLAKIK